MQSHLLVFRRTTHFLLLFLIFLLSCADEHVLSASDAGTDHVESEQDVMAAGPLSEAGSFTSSAFSEEDETDGSKAEEFGPVYGSCAQREIPSICAADSTCSWIGVWGCVRGDTLKNHALPLTSPLSGSYPGQATIVDHPVMPDGEYETRLTLWEYGGVLSGSLSLLPLSATQLFPTVIYHVGGTLDYDSGEPTLVFDRPHCVGEVDESFVTPCANLQTGMAGGFISSGFIHDSPDTGGEVRAAFPAPDPVDGDSDEWQPFIGMVIEPHGGFKPVEGAQIDSPREAIDGFWKGWLHLDGTLEGLQAHECLLAFTEEAVQSWMQGDSYRLGFLNCEPSMSFDSNNVSIFTVASMSGASAELYFSFEATLSGQTVLISGLFLEGLFLSGVVTSPAPEEGEIHPATIATENRLGSFFWVAVDEDPHQ